MIICAPALDVIIMIVCLKSTFRPWASVICPSSSTCKRILNTSGCAFSISSKRITLYGFLLTFSLSCPPSSYPTYPGGEPIILDTLCFSMYSDISTRIIACSLPNTASAKALESSVFPTPVGPRNRKEPIGLAGSFRPTLPRFTARATADTASSWPITRFFRTFSRFARRRDSPSVRRCTGIFVQSDTISATAASPTTGDFRLFLRSAFLRSFSSSASTLFCLAWAFLALSRSAFTTACSFSFRISWISLSSSSASGDGWYPASWTLDAASSIISIALSGRNRSLI